MYLLFLLYCNNWCVSNLDMFVNRWWQVYVYEKPIGNCYLFNEDGYMIEKNATSKWPVDKWHFEKSECVFIIKTNHDQITLNYYDNECWNINYEYENFMVCNCKI